MVREHKTRSAQKAQKEMWRASGLQDHRYLSVNKDAKMPVDGPLKKQSSVKTRRHVCNHRHAGFTGPHPPTPFLRGAGEGKPAPRSHARARCSGVHGCTAGLSVRGVGNKGFVTPTDTNVHGDALCFMVNEWQDTRHRSTIEQWLAVGGGWRLVAVGGWQSAVGGGWRLAVGG